MQSLEHTSSIFKAHEVTQKRKLDIKFDQDMKILEQIIRERAERRIANNQLQVHQKSSSIKQAQRSIQDSYRQRIKHGGEIVRRSYKEPTE